MRNFLLQNNNIRQTILKNIIWVSSSVTVSRIIRSLMIIYAARVLGTGHYGVFSYALSFAAIFNIFSDIGLSGILTRELVKRTEKKEYLATSFCLKIGLVILTTLAIGFISPFFTNVEAAKPLMLIMALLVAFDGLRSFLFSIYRAENRMQYEALLEILTEVFITTIGFIVIFNAPSALNFSLGYMVASGLGLIVTLIALRRYLTSTFKFFNRALVWPIFQSAWPFAVIGVFGVLMTNIDAVIIGIFLPVNDLGLYAAAQKPISLMYLIPGFLYTGLLPVISQFIHEKDENKLSILLKKALTISWGLALPIVVGGLIIANPLIRLIYGVDYTEATFTFQLLLLTLIPAFPGMILSAVLLAEDKQKVFIKSSAFGASVNIVLDFILIPWIGIAGSAIATVFAQLTANGLLLGAIKKNHQVSLWGEMKKILAALIIMTICTYLMKVLLWPIILIVVISGLIYFGLLFLFKEEVINDIKLSFRK